MTKKKKANKNEKRLNLTAHRRAMANPEVQKIFNGLRARWKGLSPQQQREKVSVLSGFKCSGRGIAKELGEPESNIRKYIPKANPLKEGSDFATMVKSTLPKEPQKQSTKRASEDIHPLPTKVPAKKRVVPVIEENYPTKDHAQASTAQQTNKIISPSSAAAKEPQVASGVISGREDERTLEETLHRLASIHDEIKPRPVASGVRDGRGNLKTIEEKKQRLASMDDQIKPRPVYNAHSMRRQGGPPKDRP